MLTYYDLTPNIDAIWQERHLAAQTSPSPRPIAETINGDAFSPEFIKAYVEITAAEGIPVTVTYSIH